MSFILARAACWTLLLGAMNGVRDHLMRRASRRQRRARHHHDESIPGYTGDACVAGVRRARRYRLVLRGRYSHDGDDAGGRKQEDEEKVENAVLPPLPLDVCVSPPPTANADVRREDEGKDATRGDDDDDDDDDDNNDDDDEDEDEPVVLYVLDPEPVLFGAASLFAFAQAAYGRVWYCIPVKYSLLLYRGTRRAYTVLVQYT